MISDSGHLALALRDIRETEELLETVIVSSEQFNYPQAKIALKRPQKKGKQLQHLLDSNLGNSGPFSRAHIAIVDFSAKISA